jgi:hypothetical protein
MTTPNRVLREILEGINSGAQTGPPIPSESESLSMRRIIDTEVKKGPMPFVGAHKPDPKNGRGVRWVGEPQDLLDKTASLRFKDERMGQFHARTGIGAAQIRSLFVTELKRLVDITSMNEVPQAPRRPR